MALICMYSRCHVLEDMVMQKRQKGFTLIELIIVVLIIMYIAKGGCS